jgi:hypothetical protein
MVQRLSEHFEPPTAAEKSIHERLLPATAEEGAGQFVGNAPIARLFSDPPVPLQTTHSPSTLIGFGSAWAKGPTSAPAIAPAAGAGSHRWWAARAASGMKPCTEATTASMSPKRAMRSGGSRRGPEDAPGEVDAGAQEELFALTRRRGRRSCRSSGGPSTACAIRASCILQRFDSVPPRGEPRVTLDGRTGH